MLLYFVVLWIKKTFYSLPKLYLKIKGFHIIRKLFLLVMLFSIHKKIFAQTIFCYCTKISDFAQICETYGQLSPRRYDNDSRGALPVAGEKQ